VSCSNEEGLQDVLILSERTEHLPLIEIRIKECQGGSVAGDHSCLCTYTRMATDLENLECSDFYRREKLGEFCATSGKNCNE